MIDDKKRSELEQSIAAMRELFPHCWRALYDGCISENFSEAQSMDLVKTYILSQNPHGIRPSNDGGSENQK
jgi:hypothetical protein